MSSNGSIQLFFKHGGGEYVLMGRILLFDHESTGHHVEYASKLLFLLQEKTDSHEIRFLPVDSDNKFRGENTPAVLKPLYHNPEPPKNNLNILLDVVDYGVENNFDILHILSIDKLVISLSALSTTTNIKIMGNIIGGFFSEKSSLRNLIFNMAENYTCHTLRTLTPRLFDKIGHYRDILFLDKIANRGNSPVDNVFVPNQLSKKYLQKVCDSAPDNFFNIVPDPTELYVCQNVTPQEAKLALNLPSSSPTVLFFGTLREDKGIDTLLKSLKRYSGPPFNMVIAGKPIDISRDRINKMNKNIAPEIKLTPDYIPESKLPLYFIASDYTVTPYKKSFGRLRPSNVFQKSIGAGTPVIAPKFGNFQELVNKWELGRLFIPGSPSSLAHTIEDIVSTEHSSYNPEKMQEYASTQTYRKLAEITLEHYNDSISV